VGEVHAAILRALGCRGLVTDGAVRDLSGVEALGFPVFARNPAISHAFAHLVDFGHPVEIGGLSIAPGDLLFGDRHGILSVPLELVGEIPAAARRGIERDRRVVEFCKSPEFTLEGLQEIVHGVR
jgi:regulator of RNase E activity RraA